MAVSKKVKQFKYLWYLLLITFFQILSCVQLMSNLEENSSGFATIFATYVAVEWLYVFLMRTLIKQKSFELEMIAFFLGGIGVALISRKSVDNGLKQVVFTLAGVFVFLVMRWLIADADRVTKLRFPAAIIAAGTLGLTFLIAPEINGAKNWISLGPVAVQPSEFVKVAFIFVGAATLDKLQTTKSVFKYLIFTLGCVGALALMKDFGAALIYFATFVIIAYVRSGDWKSLAALGVAGVIGVILLLSIMNQTDIPGIQTALNRFQNYRHVWEDPSNRGYQQTQVLMCIASGGLFGVGLGNGRLLYAFEEADNDSIFGMIGEEYGIVLGFAVLIAYAGILVYSISAAKSARNSFYVIAAIGAAGLLVVQASLNTFGTTDVLPFTGVTLPFVSRGGSSLVSCWALLAFIKSVDPRAYPKALRETQLTA
ncbi:MAG: FtsW/RodA/SpoVE family cell cycle protein [Ruminococcaceae bacterium]|nr:FtsW/RodA/SpoVE family cell cycle protein [Oscillospiraceae bacterium]